MKTMSETEQLRIQVLGALAWNQVFALGYQGVPLPYDEELHNRGHTNFILNGITWVPRSAINEYTDRESFMAAHP